MASKTADTAGAMFGEDERGVAKRWIADLDASIKYWGPYWKVCEKILDRYEDDREKTKKTGRRFAVLYSNTEVLKAATLTRVPKAVVIGRYMDDDPVAEQAAEVLERAINFSAECYDFDQVLKSVRDEYILLAKGHTWARYVPTFEAMDVQPKAVEGAADDKKPAKKGKGKAVAEAAPPEEPPPERVKYEEAVSDYVAYDDWGTNAARNWSEVRMVWRRVYMSRAALKQRFTKPVPGMGKTIGEVVPLDWVAEGSSGSNAENKELFGKAVVYEVWDLDTKKVRWVSRAFPHAVLDERDDPLGLKDFFPCPKPALGTSSPRKITPKPDYTQYSDQAGELDDITGRISVLTNAVRMVGLYSKEDKINLSQVFKAGADNDMIPVDGWRVYMEKGGIKGLIEWVPVEKVMDVLQALYEARDKVLQVIYEVTGISDVMRGDTDARETAAAQNHKVTWGSQRVREKQKEMARFARDEMNIKGEIIARKFGINTLRQMTNIKLLTRQEKAAIQALKAQYDQQVQAAGAAQPGQPAPPPPPSPIPPDQIALLGKPTWEDVDELLKSDALRQFRIDIEADSTLEPDMVDDKKDATEFITAIGGILAQALPAVQMAPPLGKLIAQSIKYAARRFKMGREMDDTIDEVMDDLSKMAPPPKPGQEKAAGGKSPQELALIAEGNAIKRQQVEGQMANDRMDAQTNAASVQADRERTASDERIAALEATVRRMEAMLTARTDMHAANGAGAMQ